MVDFVAERADDFAVYGGPDSTPGFDTLPELAQALLLDLWRLWGTGRRFPAIVAAIMDEEQEMVAPVWAIRALIERATMRRRFPGVLARFVRDGAPTYTSHATYRASNWPERATWSDAEARYISGRFFQLDQCRRRAAGLATS